MSLIKLTHMYARGTLANAWVLWLWREINLRVCWLTFMTCGRRRNILFLWHSRLGWAMIDSGDSLSSKIDANKWINFDVNQTLIKLKLWHWTLIVRPDVCHQFYFCIRCHLQSLHREYYARQKFLECISTLVFHFKLFNSNISTGFFLPRTASFAFNRQQRWHFISLNFSPNDLLCCVDFYLHCFNPTPRVFKSYEML